MSTFPEHRDVGTCQEKLAPPRSLRDEGADAEMIWNVIVERYPKAAPLLCEMELAIERAENLLHKFRAAPCANVREIARPNPTRSSNSDGSSTMLTANSETQFSTSEENYDVGGVGTRMSDDSISKDDDRANTSSSSSCSEDRDYANSSSPSVPEFTVDETTNENTVKDSKSVKNHQSNENHRPTNSTSEKEESPILATGKMGKKVSSSEKVVNGKFTDDVKSANDNKDISKVSPDVPRDPDAPAKEPTTQMASSKASSARDTIEIVAEAPMKIISAAGETQSPATKIPRAEFARDPRRRSRTSSDASPIKGAMKNVPIDAENERINMDREKMVTRANRTNDDRRDETAIKSMSNHDEGKGDEVSAKIPSGKEPVTILEDYAKQCNETPEFRVIRSKTNSCEIKCSFASYEADSVGHPEASVRNAVAVRILRLIAEAQMDEKNMKNLKPFSNQQMRDVIALGTDGQPENAMRKLFKLCLEKNSPSPVYTTRKDWESTGVKYFAECRALGITATGEGIREEVAKKSAAEALYVKLPLGETSRGSKGAKCERPSVDE